MKQFIIKIILFGVAFFLLEKVFYAFLFVSPFLEKDKRLEYIISGNMNKDLIVLGSSRGARNIIASQIEDSLNISCYNLSYPGSNIEFHEFVLRSLIKYNNKPKIALLVVDDSGELLPSKSLKFRLDRLYPLTKYDYINNEMIERGENSFLSKFLILARIRKQNFDIRQKQFGTLDTLVSCGSMPISFQRENRKFIFENNVRNYEAKSELPEKLQAFKRVQSLCDFNDIQLILVYPPNFKKHNTFFQKRIEGLSGSSFSSILYDTSNVNYRDKDYFYDESHLKTNGAVIFTNEIIQHLQQKVRKYNKGQKSIVLGAKL